MHSATFESPVGELTITTEGDRLVGVDWGGAAERYVAHGAATTENVERQLAEYFGGRRKEFDLPIELNGVSEFACRVLEVMATVPYGETITYGELAAEAGSPGAARAVGRVCGANPIAIVIPCHRVVGASGLGGFGPGPAIKKRLLALEGITVG